jgi:aldehyde:ferredoxin oxidoreductase
MKQGKVLRVNLTSGNITVETLSEGILRRYYGGSALASYFLLNELKPGTDPLGEDNVLVITCSVLSGLPIPGASRFTIAAKSPLTGAFGESEAGGWWAPEFARAGFIAAVITGRSPKPVYLWVKDGKAEIRDASHLTGKMTGEAEELIRQELDDPRIIVAQTGPGGEKLVRYACVLNNLKHANGRTGMGAVFGSKNLRAVAVRGTQKTEAADEVAIKELAQWFAQNWKNNAVNVRLNKYGTAHNLNSLQATGTLPTFNFRRGDFAGAEKLCGETMSDTILEKNEGCFACPVRCKRVARDETYQVDSRYGGPEYETIGGFGSLCGIDDLRVVAKAHELCNKYGIDTISASVAVSFAMECFDEGIIDTTMTDGLSLDFGNAEAVLKLVEMIGERQGIGVILGEGVVAAAREFGKGSEKFAIHVKGQEFAAHEPRGKTGVALGFALSPTGADHLEMAHDIGFADYTNALENIGILGILEPVDTMDLTYRKLRLFYNLQLTNSFNNCAGFCNLVTAPAFTFTFDKLVEIVAAATGWKTSLWEFMKVGERANVMARVFNTREGLTPADDTLPDRFFAPMEEGPLKGVSIDRDQFHHLIREYYTLSGWDENGVPTKAKLGELDLEWISAG